MSAEEAAGQIVRALETGSAWEVLGLPARAGALAYALFPSAVVGLLSFVAGLLPAPRSGGQGRARGHEIATPDVVSALTRSTDAAAAANNERSARRPASDLPG
jgi:hypothetical protein